MSSYLIHEKARCPHEAKLPRESSNYCVDPSTIYKSIRPLKDQPLKPENLTDALERLYNSITPTRFLVIEFKTYHDSGPRWTRNVGKAIEPHRVETEHLLNWRNLNPDSHHTYIHLTTHDHTRYLWHNRPTLNAWLTLLKHEYFYFDTTDTKNLEISNEANEIMRTIRKYPCQLLDDERNLIQSLDIKMQHYTRTIQLHETQRVSVTWEIETSHEDDAISFALQATPAGGPKRQAVENWLKSQEIDYKTVREKLKSHEAV